MALVHVSISNCYLLEICLLTRNISVLFGDLTSWGYFICLSCSFATATTQKIPIKICSLILTSQSLTISLTWRNTLFARYVFALYTSA